jgi:hypothetical protein
MAVKWVRINETWYSRPVPTLGMGTPPGSGRGFASERLERAIPVNNGRNNSGIKCRLTFLKPY